MKGQPVERFALSSLALTLVPTQMDTGPGAGTEQETLSYVVVSQGWRWVTLSTHGSTDRFVCRLFACSPCSVGNAAQLSLLNLLPKRSKENTLLILSSELV